mmetsp:Transcript_14/g.39  ORF Transcript_14/g.39 Transcript_14/m.39 type:complete len:100 (-) Transcript_14:48-347(-)
MNELSMEAFERRATEAEDRLSLLEKKLASKASGGGVSEDMICNLLAVLYEVRGTLGKEKNNQMLSEKKQKSLQKQVFELREENSKLKYQILHLKRNFRK